MVSGKGLIAEKFKPRFDNDSTVLILGAGVSNSKCVNPGEFEREYNLVSNLIKENKGCDIVYFSTCSIQDPEENGSMYIKHKLRMEELIASTATNFYIFRISNLAGSTHNKNTIVNFLFNKINNNQTFDVWVHAERNIIDIDDMYLVVLYVLENGIYKNEIINIANTRNYPVGYLVSEIEKFCNKKALKNEIVKGGSFIPDLTKTWPILQKLGISFPDGYFPFLLHKYFSKA